VAVAATAEQAHHQQQYQRTDQRIDDQRDDAAAEMDMQSRQQPVADECANQSHQQVADETKAGALHDLAGQPAGNNADDEYDEQAFIREMHAMPPPRSRTRRLWNRCPSQRARLQWVPMQQTACGQLAVPDGPCCSRTTAAGAADVAYSWM